MSIILYAYQNSHGVSVNETALCEDCRKAPFNVWAALEAWEEAEDTNLADEPEFLPADNPDAICNGCTLSQYELTNQEHDPEAAFDCCHDCG